jgi:transcription initiation factor TFIID TATA-box-binding protein
MSSSSVSEIEPKKNIVTLKIENVVASVRISSYLNLDLLIERYRDVEKKENFPGLVIKIKKPKSTILIFRSGKMVITGTKNIKNIPIIVEKVVKRLTATGCELDMEPEIKVENIVASGNFHTPINLDLTSITLERTIYEPEVFPGLIYKVPVPKVCFLIFSSGKIICTGAKKEAKIRIAVRDLAVKLKEADILGRKDNFDGRDLY